MDITTQAENIEVIKNIIRIKNGSLNNPHLAIEACISATVNGNLLIDNDTIGLDIIYYPHKPSMICIYWEKYGYKKYKSMGLYGSMNTDYQDFKMEDDNTLIISCDNYKIEIKLDDYTFEKND